MQCPRCMGMRKIVEYDYLRKVYYSHKCEHCNGTGEIEQTNEEWLKSCNTEEMAKGIYECVMANSWSFRESGVLRWLKQPHSEVGK